MKKRNTKIPELKKSSEGNWWVFARGQWCIAQLEFLRGFSGGRAYFNGNIFMVSSGGLSGLTLNSEEEIAANQWAGRVKTPPLPEKKPRKPHNPLCTAWPNCGCLAQGRKSDCANRPT